MIDHTHKQQYEGAGECKYALSAITHLKISVKPACIHTEYLENQKNTACVYPENFTTSMNEHKE